ncbi:ATP-dependent RNA helicase RhlE [mine drainage metagenome]|uniref:ATP-dependent RNA helicase RhlE n=1 Tax=mine drainage metagenome TaxID=410659 RepID=A0A1J5SKN1_9ZZZZ
MSFADLSLHPLLLKALEAEGYTEATPVQAAAIPAGLEGRDLLATAETGTGKTAAFLLPALSRLVDKMPRPAGAPRILVLAPTRELARQVLQSARVLGKFMRLNTVELVGGMPYRDQLRLLARPVDVVVATPGRLIDHVQRGRLFLDGVEVLVLDEADRMLDMGFLEDVEAVAAACGPQRQTMLFTATLDQRMGRLAERLLKDPVRVAVERTETAPLIEQRLHHADDLTHKRRLLHHFADQSEVSKAIIFAATKRDADTLARELLDAGHAAGALHGDMSQGQRNRTLEQLRQGRIRLLVATDVAARGIDVRDISHVINFDLPRVPEDYVHRIGRTGRAGAEGVAISLASRADREALQRIELYLKTRMAVHVVPGLEPKRPLSAAPAARPAGKGRPFVKSGKGRPGGKPGGPRTDRPHADRPHQGAGHGHAARSGEGRKEGGQAPRPRKSAGRG